MLKLKEFFSGLKLRGNSYVALALQFLLMMVLYAVCRVLFYLFNTSFFPDMTLSRFTRILGGGVRFDLAGLLYLNSLFIILSILPFHFRFRQGYQKVLKYIYFVTNGVGLAINIADIFYYKFTLRRTTISVFSQFKNEKNKLALFFQFVVDYWYAVFVLAALVWFMVYLFNRIKISGPQLQNKWAFYSSGLLMMPIIVYLFFGGARGGFAHSTRPITLSNAAEYAAVPKDINLVLNTPFALMRTINSAVVEKVNYFASDSELAKTFTPVHYPADSTGFRARNVVVIILESFSREFVGIYNRDMGIKDYKGYTPFLDSLIGESLAFHYSFANGRKSIDAMPSVICSIPSIEVPYVLSHFSGNKVNSMASLLKDKGYYSAFFHGAPNGSMGFQAFANLCGFDDYFGKTEYGNDDDYDGIWGIWDEKFLQFYANKMNTFKQPFYTNFFSVSSHHPYNLPAGYATKFKGGSKDIYKTLEYTDYSLKKFFETAKKMPWYENTLFVFTADHCSAEITYPEFNTAWGYFSIPVFFFKPDGSLKSMKPEIIQQIDIMPTVLGYLHYDKPYIAFGRNILDPQTAPFAFNYLDNVYQAFIDNYLLQFDGTKSIGLYNFKEDKLLKNNLISGLPEVVAAIEPRLKAFIQQYNNRMVDDDLTMEGSQLKAAAH